MHRMTARRVSVHPLHPNLQETFPEFCDALWQAWLNETIDASPFVRDHFDLDAAPEPFLLFGTGAAPLVALTTNPGEATMREQHRKAVRAGASPLRPTLDYTEAARALGDFYAEQLTGPARRRIDNLRCLAQWAGYDGVLQVEACPFHSRSLPKTAALRREIEADSLLGRYAEHVRAFLRPRPVVIVAAVSSRQPLRAGMELPWWAAFQANLAGMAPARARFWPLVEKELVTTAGAWVSSEAGAPKALVLMMGGNRLPGERGLRVLADALRSADAP